ncbi:aldehyde dehydrogenase family protein [Escherichia coli]
MATGGKAPVIVFDDADIEAVVEGVRTFGYYNAGQDCTAACPSTYAQKAAFTIRWWKNWRCGGNVKNLVRRMTSYGAWTFKLAGASRTRQQGSRRGESDRAHQKRSRW